MIFFLFIPTLSFGTLVQKKTEWSQLIGSCNLGGRGKGRGLRMKFVLDRVEESQGSESR